VDFPDLARRQDVIVHHDEHALMCAAGEAATRTAASRFAGRPSRHPTRCAWRRPDDRLGREQHEIEQNAVSSIVSVPCVMTTPSMSGRSSQAAGAVRAATSVPA
jgi:hypothetical protein